MKNAKQTDEEMAVAARVLAENEELRRELAVTKARALMLRARLAKTRIERNEARDAAIFYALELPAGVLEEEREAKRKKKPTRAA